MTEKKKIKFKKSEAEKLSAQLEELTKEKDDLFAQLQRISADYANYQRRVPKQISDRVAYEKEKILKSLLPAMDSFEHTLANIDSAERDDLVKGINIIYDQMVDILKSQGVEQIESAGEKFDPAFHQAMMRREEPDREEEEVLEEFQKGYKLGDRVLRPSKVIVNKLPVEEVEEEDGGDESIEENEE